MDDILQHRFKLWYRTVINPEYFRVQCPDQVDRKDGEEIFVQIFSIRFDSANVSVKIWYSLPHIANTFTVEEFIRDYELPSKPVIIYNAMKDWTANKNWTIDALVKKYAEIKVSICSYRMWLQLYIVAWGGDCRICVFLKYYSHSDWNAQFFHWFFETIRFNNTTPFMVVRIYDRYWHELLLRSSARAQDSTWPLRTSSSTWRHNKNRDHSICSIKSTRTTHRTCCGTTVCRTSSPRICSASHLKNDLLTGKFDLQ